METKVFKTAVTLPVHDETTAFPRRLNISQIVSEIAGKKW